MHKLKIFTFTLLLCFTMSMLAACGGKKEDSPSPSKAKEEKTADKDLAAAAEEAVKYFGYSEKEAVENLVKEGYSEKEAQKAFEELKVDWVDQAAKRAEDHYNSSYYSKAEMIETLIEYDGFSKEQAEQGVEKSNLDWKKSAVDTAKDLVETIGYTKAEDIAKVKELLIDQKFTEEEAEYGANNCGLQ